jgi:stage III sporulation protein AD
MIRIALIGIIAVFLSIQFKNGKSEYGTYISLAACIIIFGLGISKLELIIETIHKIQSYIVISQTYIVILIKIIGITYVAEFASNLCKDAGHAAISNQIELVGKLTILSISMPILMALLETINNFLI